MINDFYTWQKYWYQCRHNLRGIKANIIFQNFVIFFLEEIISFFFPIKQGSLTQMLQEPGK